VGGENEENSLAGAGGAGFDDGLFLATFEVGFDFFASSLDPLCSWLLVAHAKVSTEERGYTSRTCRVES
jgi:hypothetical protein